MQRRHVFRLLAAATLAAATAGTALPALAANQTIRLGTMSGPDAQIWEVVREVAKRKGLDIKIIEFNDYAQPNAALDAGDLDANSFQHQPYLESQVQARHYKIVNVGLTYIAPMGYYSRKFKSLKDLPQGAKVGIQNDPSNGDRALKLLQQQGLVKLKAGAGAKGTNASPLDIVSNPKKLKIVELDSAILPRSLDDLAAAAINTDYAVKAGLSPQRDAIALENLKGPYANVIVVREQDRNKPWVKDLVASYQSQEVRDFLAKQFKGAILPAF